jgi:glutamate-1-semialdehyde 2,1-aminomutase
MYEASREAFSQACRYMPGGVNSPVRAFGGVGLTPLFITSAKGSRVFDIDGNEYIDYVGSWGPMILGHAHPAVVAAIHRAAEKGASFGAPTVAETRLAERICGAVPSIEKLRLLSSGTEAVMTAIRLARAHTGRDLIVKMAGGYHGHSDSLLVEAGSGVAEIPDRGSRIADSDQDANPQSGGIPSSPGVPDALAALTIVVPYNDVEALRRAFAGHSGRIATVLVEPVAANMGVVPPARGYLQTLRSLCDENGSLLIFDEVITGFRVAFGGAQALYGVRPDLTCLGKIVGGGLPLAVCGGRADIMDRLAPCGPVYQAGTLSGNPIATAAAIATLDILAEGRCHRELEFSAANLEAGLLDAASDAGVAITINRVGSILSGFFTPNLVRNFDDVRATDVAAFKRFFAGMLQRGIYLAPSAYEAWFVSTAHTKADIDQTVDAAREALRAIAD